MAFHALRAGTRQKAAIQQLIKCQLCQASSESQPMRTPLQRAGYLDCRIHQQQVRHMSGQPPNFFKNVWNEIKEGLQKDQEMKKNLKKFREETKKLEESDALQKAKEKYMNIQKETGEEFGKKFGEVKDKLSGTLHELSEHEMAKKGKEFTKETFKSAGNLAETVSKGVSKGGQQLGQSKPIQTISEAVKNELKDIDTTRAQSYKKPEVLRMRTEDSVSFTRKDEVEINEEDTGMVLHKDSKFYQSWTNFKDNNQYVNKMFELKMKYDESDNVMVRVTRTFTDKVGSVLGGMFTTTEMSEVLTEICKIDPTFDKENFIKMCQLDFIPNILEATLSGNLEILKDWCFEGAFNTLAHTTKQRQTVGLKLDHKVLDINNIEIVAAKMMEQGPVLIISFRSQEIRVIRDMKGKIVEGDLDTVSRITYVWALCRDQEEYNPRAAWKLLDVSEQIGEMWL
ncbi:mitochondrial import inner membrane translocase subunit TIM44-like [Pecten maximus]|uniref:mitochondrial import inner membrane translocase subunit TIM44-like n=1 Tax=Pecten maximus TaxID=6579 RepID=UPI00145840AD|nr:mitochondrial import inner membrane translocase subunit TIM44-like [Pecten maximus]